MAVVEPEAACVHQHIPVIRVSEGGEGRGEAHRASGGGDEERKEEEEGLLFLSVWGFAFTKWSTNVCLTVTSKLPRLIKFFYVLLCHVGRIVCVERIFSFIHLNYSTLVLFSDCCLLLS